MLSNDVVCLRSFMLLQVGFADVEEQLPASSFRFTGAGLSALDSSHPAAPEVPMHPSRPFLGTVSCFAFCVKSDASQIRPMQTSAVIYKQVFRMQHAAIADRCTAVMAVICRAAILCSER